MTQQSTAVQIVESPHTKTVSRQQMIPHFLARCQKDKAEISPLAGDASFRRYYRILHEGRSYMLMDAPPEKESIDPFIRIARFLEHAGYSAPSLVEVDSVSGFILMEDLGDALFAQVMQAQPEKETMLYTKAVDMLGHWHNDKRFYADSAQLHLPAFSHDKIIEELRLFVDWYIPQALGAAQAMQIREAFLQNWHTLLEANPIATSHFVHRDFHAENLMWLDGREDLHAIGLLDFQDAVWGHPAYDLASLLEDARRDVSPEMRSQLFDRYLQSQPGTDRGEFEKMYAIQAAQRNLKIIGIFARLAKRDGKQRYLSLIPRVWKYLEQDITHPCLKFIRYWLNAAVPQEVRYVDLSKKILPDA